MDNIEHTPASERMQFGLCDCEYPCSCVALDGKEYGSWGDIIDALDSQLQRAAEDHDTAATDRVMALMVRVYGAQHSDETREQAKRLARAALGGQLDPHTKDSHVQEREMTLFLLFAGADYYPGGGAEDFVAGHHATSDEDARVWAETVEHGEKWMHLVAVEGDGLRPVWGWWRDYDWKAGGLGPWKSGPGLR